MAHSRPPSNWASGFAVLILACSSESSPDGAGGSGTGTGSGGSGASATGSGGSPSTGGSGVGGSPVSGGSSGSGGAAAGGSGGGSGGTGGAPSGSGGAAPSSGCGAANPPAEGPYSVDVDGSSRDYILAPPSGYDPNRAYPLIFVWHPRGGSADQVAGGFMGGYNGLQALANDGAIFVAPDGIDDGWANTNGRDIAFLRAMLDRFNTELCIDQSRIFSTGFSYGGMMSFAVGCAMGDVFRAIAPIAGALYSGCEDGSAPIAMWGAHGIDDSVVPLDHGRQGLQEILDRNGCGTETAPIEPSPCVSYQGCTAGSPVTWCEFPGDHMVPNFAAQAIWDFFSQF